MSAPESNPGRNRKNPAGEAPPVLANCDALCFAAGIGRTLLAHSNTIKDLDPIARGVLNTGARCAVILVRAEGRDTSTVEAAADLDALENRAAFLDAARRLAAWTYVAREPLLIDDYSADPRFPSEAPVSGSFAAIPLLVFGEAVGALIAFDRREQGAVVPFSDGQVTFLTLLGDQAAMAVHTVRLADRLGRAEKKLKGLESEILRKESFATLGEMTGALIGEIRQPVTAITGFARRVARALPQGDLNREYLDVIISEAERLERVVTEHMEMVPTSRSKFRMEDLNAVAEGALRGLSEAMTGRKVRCLKRLAAGLPLLLLDSEKIEHMIRNILQDLLAGVPPGGRLKIESKRTGETIHLLIAGDGPRSPGDVLERLFVPFRGQRSQGPGLAITHQIVKEHGGEISIRSDADWPTVFTVTFPIKVNEDRRRPGTERRRTPRDRRAKGQGRSAA